MNNHQEYFDLVVFNRVEKKVLSEISVSASSISKAVKKVRMNLGIDDPRASSSMREDPSVLVLQKSCVPSLGIFSFETTARLHHHA